MGFWSIQETPRQNLRGKKSVFVLFEIFFWRLVKNNTNTGNFAGRLRWKLLNSEGKWEDIRCRSQDWQKVYVSIAQIIWDKTKKAGQPHLSFSKYHKEDFQRMYFCICRRRKPVKKKKINWYLPMEFPIRPTYSPSIIEKVDCVDVTSESDWYT